MPVLRLRPAGQQGTLPRMRNANSCNWGQSMKRLPWILASVNAIVNLTFLAWCWCQDEQGQGGVLLPLILALINFPASLLAFPLGWIIAVLAQGSLHDHPYVLCSLTFVPIGFAQYYLIGVAIRKLTNWRLYRRRRLTSGLCLKCGYDLRATPDRCPECGTPAIMTEAKA